MRVVVMARFQLRYLVCREFGFGLRGSELQLRHKCVANTGASESV